MQPIGKHVVLADAGYGEVHDFREGLTALGLRYVVGVPRNIAVWPPDTSFRVPARTPGKIGRPASRALAEDDSPLSIDALAGEAAIDTGHEDDAVDGGRGKKQPVAWD